MTIINRNKSPVLSHALVSKNTLSFETQKEEKARA